MPRKAASFSDTLVRPMLAVAADESQLRALAWPRLASAKVDGVRALCRISPVTGEPELVSRTLKPIPNTHVQQLYARPEYVGLDGELCVGELTDKNLMQQTTSGIMSYDGEPDAKWMVFDRWDMDAPYYKRAQSAKFAAPYWLPQFPVKGYDELIAMEDRLVTEGYEGLIIRHPHAPYKQNRSTLREGYMLKMKRFVDSEAIVTGFEELQHNLNEATIDERGYTKRSSHMGNKVAAGRLGCLIGWDNKYNWEVRAFGFTLEQSINLWEGRQHLKGLPFTYKFFPVGVKDKPRHPTFKAFRSRIDM